MANALEIANLSVQARKLADRLKRNELEEQAKQMEPIIISLVTIGLAKFKEEDQEMKRK